jgi:hypothetical protein
VHTYASTSPHYYDVKLYTLDRAGHTGYYRQALPLEFQPTLYPAVAPASEPAPPATDPCGTLSAPEQAFITGLGNAAFTRLGGTTQVDGSYTTADGGVGGSVPATLALSLGTPAAFGAFTLGLLKDYEAKTTANVVSTAGDATLSVADPSATATGHLVNGAFSLPSALQASSTSPNGTGGAPAAVGGSGSPTTLLSYAKPVGNDGVSVTFLQHIGATDPLRTGSYSKTLTFTLSTTTP